MSVAVNSAALYMAMAPGAAALCVAVVSGVAPQWVDKEALRCRLRPAIALLVASSALPSIFFADPAEDGFGTRGRTRGAARLRRERREGEATSPPSRCHHPRAPRNGLSWGRTSVGSRFSLHTRQE